MAVRSSIVKSKLGNMNRFKRLEALYCTVVLIPLIIIDVLLFSFILSFQRDVQQRELEGVANAIHYTFFNQIDEAAKLGNSVATSKYVNDFITKKYSSNLEYYEAYQEFFNDTLIDLVNGQSGMKYRFFIDNDTITNGGEFHKISKASNDQWYKYMIRNKMTKGLYFEYSLEPGSLNVDERKIYYFQRLNYYDFYSNNVMLIELDYKNMSSILKNMNYSQKAYICDDTRVLLSNGGYVNRSKDYYDISVLGTGGYKQEIMVYSQELAIIVQPLDAFWLVVLKAWWQLFVIMILATVLIPFLLITRGRLREKEELVASQKAQLLALQSQINPHFLFNALESIRMHSLLKQEMETSQMVEHLAKLQRQYTEWESDYVPIEKECEFVEAYLSLQKYRFGDRLSFEIDVEDCCREIKIPKLTIVTFVENACVHGIEGKATPGWIFVRVFEKDEMLVLEIEDTGAGLEEEKRLELEHKMKDANIDMLMEKGRVGIVNACVRLKILTRNEAEFEIESEAKIGTLIQIKLPIKLLKGIM